MERVGLSKDYSLKKRREKRSYWRHMTGRHGSNGPCSSTDFSYEVLGDGNASVGLSARAREGEGLLVRLVNAELEGKGERCMSERGSCRILKEHRKGQRPQELFDKVKS